MAKVQTTEEQLAEILNRAIEGGYANEGKFATTYKAYCVQTRIMDELAKGIEEEGAIVTTVYIADKKRETKKPSQLIGDYNKTSTARNGTVATLLKIAEKYEKPATGKLSGFVE